MPTKQMRPMIIKHEHNGVDIRVFILVGNLKFEGAM